MTGTMKKAITLAELTAKFHDGMSVMMGGFLGNGTPERIVDALVESGVKDLTLITNDTSYPEMGCGRLIANHQVKKLIVSHIGTNPLTGEQLNDGSLEIEFSPQGTLEYLLEKPIRAEFAFLKGSIGDEKGNLVYKGTSQNFQPLMAMAADTVVVEIEELVPVGAIEPHAVHTPSIFVDHIVVDK